MVTGICAERVMYLRIRIYGSEKCGDLGMWRLVCVADVTSDNRYLVAEKDGCGPTRKKFGD